MNISSHKLFLQKLFLWAHLETIIAHSERYPQFSELSEEEKDYFTLQEQEDILKVEKSLKYIRLARKELD